MKRIYKVLLTIILCFCFSSTVDAYYEYIYSDTEGKIKFKVIDTGNSLTVTPLNEFTYNDETKGPSDSWSGNDIKLLLTSSDTGTRIDFSHNSYKKKTYLYYDIRFGKNKFYLSDLDMTRINSDVAKDIDLMFVLQEVEYGPLQPVESGTYRYKVTCGKLNSNLGYSLLSSSSEFIKKNELSIDIKDTGIDVNKSSIKSSQIEICGAHRKLDGTEQNQPILDFSLIKDEKTDILKQGLAVVKFEAFDDSIFIIPTYYYDSTERMFNNGDISASVEKLLQFDKEIINENSTEIFKCEFNINPMGDSADNMFTIKYNKTTGSFSADHVEGAGFLKGGEEFITQDIKDEMIKGSCPEKVYFCGSDPYTDHYFSTEKLDDCMIAGGESLDNNLLSSEEFKRLLGALKSPLMEVSTEALSYNLKLDGKDITLDNITANTDLCNPNYCNNNPRELTITGLKNVKSYCREKIEKIDRNLYSAVDIENREEECVAFDAFYDRLVKEGIIYDLAEGCGFISDDLNAKLVLILDVIKIAGPVLAILFGMWDFTKVLFTGDADKEMKTAGKRFITRIIAAALLFLIPALIKIPLNIALEDQIDVDNPFCDVVE